MRRIVANLDCELSWARGCTPGPHKELPREVRRAVSSASLALAVFAQPGDELWTLEEVATVDTADSTVRLISGPLAAHTPVPTLFWGQTESTSVPRPKDDASLCWQDRLWRLSCSPAIAAAVNDRRFALELARELSLEPYPRAVSSMAELDELITREPLGKDDAWVAKAPIAASGRERVRRRGRVLDGDARTRTERLLQRYGQLMVEPWHERIADYGTIGLVGEHDIVVFPTHTLLCDAGGVFRGIDITDDDSQPAELVQVAREIGAALAARGYRGPFSVDAYRYREAGRERTRSLCEINARMTFGHVARARFEHTGGERTRLRI